MSKRPLWGYHPPEQHNKVRILSQPDLELRRLQQQNEALKDENETLKDENEVLKNEADRLRRKVAELDFDMDELMNSESKTIVRYGEELKQLYSSWEEEALEGQNQRNKVYRLQEELKATKREQNELRRNSEQRASQLLEELKVIKTERDELKCSAESRASRLLVEAKALKVSDAVATNASNSATSRSILSPGRTSHDSDEDSETNPASKSSNSLSLGAEVPNEHRGTEPVIRPTKNNKSVKKSTLQLPEDAADSKWFMESYKYLTEVDLGEEYITLVQMWIKFEGVNHWKTTKQGLSKRSRPDGLSKWIQGSRQKSREPDLNGDSFSSFTRSFWDWWLKLQPRWRQAEAVDQLKPAKTFGNEWHTLDKYGKNGWFCLLVSLKWWGAALPHQSADKWEQLHDDWLRAICDVSAMLDGLIQYRTK